MPLSCFDVLPESLARPLRRGHIAERVVDGELILYDPKHQRLHALNSTAAFIWHACDGKYDADAIATMLAQRYPEDVLSIKEDVPGTLGLFLQEGLLQA